MRIELSRSFAVRFRDSKDPAAKAWLERLDALVAELGPLVTAGQCVYENTLREQLPVDRIVTAHTIRVVFMKQLGKSRGVAETTMQALFNLYIVESNIQVRFYCVGYGHTQETCECAYTIDHRGHRLTKNHRGRFKSLKAVGEDVASRWYIDRQDLLALTYDQIDNIPQLHHEPKKNLKLLIKWLRENSDSNA